MPSYLRARLSSAGTMRGPLLAALALAAPSAVPASCPPWLTVFAAASFQDVLPEIARAWKAEGGPEVRFSFSATSKIVPQVIEGAPADAVVTADAGWMDRLEASGMTVPGSRTILARNRLVFVVPADAPRAPASVDALPGRLRNIALAGENVPAGKYAKAALERAKVWSAVESRVVRAEDVRLALRWVSVGDAEGGVVYRTDAKADPGVRIAFEFPEASHEPIVCPAAVVANAAHAALAASFLEFCRGPRGRAILEKHGFLSPSP